MEISQIYLKKKKKNPVKFQRRHRIPSHMDISVSKNNMIVIMGILD